MILTKELRAWLSNLPHVLPHSFSHHRLGPLGSGRVYSFGFDGVLLTEQFYVSTICCFDTVISRGNLGPV